ncbi:MAG: AAA family ATPase, partial [Candidatus Micrarchaeia archaeon]
MSNDKNEKILGLEEVLEILLEENPEIRSPEELAKIYLSKFPEATKFREIVEKEARVILLKKGKLNSELPIIFEKDLENISTTEIKWIVENYVPEKSIVMLAGKRASFKSWGALHLALAIASGSKAFGQFNTRKTFVLYIDEENGLEEIKRKVEMIKAGMGLSYKLDNLAFLCFEGLKLDRSDAREKLKNFLEKYPNTVIVVDTFRRIISAEENDATEMNRVFTEYLRKFQEEYGATWILIHHLRKSPSSKKIDDILDELRGSSEITNVADSVIVFERPPRLDNRFILKHAKARRCKQVEPYIIELRWNDSEKSVVFECVGTAEEILDSVDLCMKAIMAWLEENGILEFATSDVKEEMKKSYSKATVERALATLLIQGKIVRIKRGHYRRVTEKTLENYEASKPQSPQDANKTKMESKEENINNLKLYNNERIDASENLNRLNTIKSEAIDASEINEIVEKESQKLPKILAEKKGLACYRCGSTEGLVQVEDF